MRRVLAAVLALVPLFALAQSRPSGLAIEPAAPLAGELVAVRHETPCAEDRVVVVRTRPQHALVVLAVSDTCDPRSGPRSERHELGRFEPGTLTIDYVLCACCPPPDVPFCDAAGSESLVVGGAAPQPVPAAASPALAGLAFALFVLALRRIGAATPMTRRIR